MSAVQSQFERHKKAIKKEIEVKLRRNFGKSLDEASCKQIYKAAAMTIQDQIMENWSKTEKQRRLHKNKRVYYMSFEFLMGRTFGNNMMNLEYTELYREVLGDLGFDLNTIEEMESDAGLGNGGLGRLAACFLDSLTTLNLPAYGCGIRYEYGLFKQKIVDGYQIEMPDPWLQDHCVWEVERPEEQVEVHFGGEVENYFENGEMKFSLKNYTTVIGVPYDVPIVGYKTSTVNTLRLWRARSPKHLDMNLFSHGDYLKAMEERELAEVLSKVLYPEDNHLEGKILRLKQQYFFSSATIQWIISSLKSMDISLYDMPKYVAIQINDTHPGIAIPELMRLLIDEENISWDDAWNITTQVFNYTNHTVLFEALEKWHINMFKLQLPRVYMIIEEINRRLVETLRQKFGDDWGKINYMSVLNDGYISMANLCLCTCNAINGVSELHTNILRNEVFKDYNIIYPEKFKNITNGITFRRWLTLANPQLDKLITDTVGDFHFNPEKLKELKNYASDPSFQESFADIKMKNKAALSDYILSEQGIKVDPCSIFDSQIKRLHEYKRQLLNLFHILYLYNHLKDNPSINITPRTFIFAAKASPGYRRAKLIIKLINTAAEVINNDKTIDGKLKVIFLENYGVSMAQKIIPATDLSEQISTAGKEASGTGNMKFMLNGAVTVGTLDGANIEMLNYVGKNNIYIFGLKADEVSKSYQSGNKLSQEIYSSNYDLKKIVDSLIDGTFEPDKPDLFRDIYQSLIFGDNNMPDPYMVLRDFESYTKIHEKISKDYLHKEKWNAKAINNVAESWYFSSDRTISEYNDKIWKL